jgi:hypothetical protein
MTNEQLEGYKLCMTDLNDMLNRSIRVNHGMVTAMQAWNVVNDVIHFTHTQDLRIKSEQKNPTQILMLIGGM